MMVLIAILIMTGLITVLALFLSIIHVKLHKKEPSLVDEIDDILPQTQCGQCGYPGCRPYAEAIAAGQADINQCPPGGEEGIRRLAELLGRDFKKLDQSYGEQKEKAVALIDESICIGCTLCIQACPVDAIVGAAKQIHTVIKEDCTGCELCIAPCPVNCIHMVPLSDDVQQWQRKYRVIPIQPRN